MSHPAICFACEPFRDRHGGFSHFVFPLTGELVRQNHRCRFSCYVAAAEVGAQYFTQRSFHKHFTPPSSRFRRWHATSQLSWHVPTNPFTKGMLTVHDLNFLHESPDERNYTRPFLFSPGSVNAKKNFHVLPPTTWPCAASCFSPDFFLRP